MSVHAGSMTSVEAAIVCRNCYTASDEGGRQTWVGGDCAGEVVGLCRQQDVPVTLLGLQSCRPSLCQGQDGLGLAAPATPSLLSVWQQNQATDAPLLLASVTPFYEASLT